MLNETKIHTIKSVLLIRVSALRPTYQVDLDIRHSKPVSKPPKRLFDDVFKKLFSLI